MPIEPTKLNLLNLNTDGTFAPSGNLNSKPEDVEAIFEHIRDNQIEHLILYFHGGRIDEADGVASARALMPLFTEQVEAHPVFFVWESSELEVITGKLDAIAQNGLYQSVRDTVMRFTLSKLRSPLGTRGIGNLLLVPDARLREEEELELGGARELTARERSELEAVTAGEEEQLEEVLQVDQQFRESATAITVAVEERMGVPDETRSPLPLGAEPADLRELDSDLVEELTRELAPVPESRGLVSQLLLIRRVTRIFRRVIARMMKGTDHGVVCTVNEEVLRGLYGDKIGQWIWSEMKQEIDNAFMDNTGLDSIALHGGTHFIDRLSAYVADVNSSPLNVSLVGHSAGSIYICRLLQEAVKTLPANFRFKNVVFLAPGVRFDLFQDSVVKHQDQIDTFRMYTMGDELESADALVPVNALTSALYPRSLLYFVSGLLEGDEPAPIVGMERFYSGQAPYAEAAFDATREFVTNDAMKRVVWSETLGAPAGLNCSAASHGGFSVHPSTQTSLAHLLQ